MKRMIHGSARQMLIKTNPRVDVMTLSVRRVLKCSSGERESSEDSGRRMHFKAKKIKLKSCLTFSFVVSSRYLFSSSAVLSREIRPNKYVAYARRVIMTKLVLRVIFTTVKNIIMPIVNAKLYAHGK